MRVFVVAVNIAAVVVLAACGSSGGGSGSSSTLTQRSSSGASASVPATPAAKPPATASSGGPASAAAFCASVAKLGQQFSTLTAQASDPAGLRKVLGTEAAFLARLKAQAPAEIEPAVAHLATLLNEAKTALTDPSKPDLAKLQALATTLPQDTQKLETWATSHCGG